METRKQYFRDKAMVFIWFIPFATVCTIASRDAEPAVQWIVPIFTWGIPVGAAIYGLLKYKK